MSPFLVYLVMQASNISTMLVIASFLLLFCVPIAIVNWDYAKENESKDEVSGAYKLVTRLVKSLVVVTLLAVLTPNSKTAASMIILPKLTSPEAMHKIEQQGGELLELTKEALRSVADKNNNNNK